MADAGLHLNAGGQARDPDLPEFSLVPGHLAALIPGRRLAQHACSTLV